MRRAHRQRDPGASRPSWHSGRPHGQDIIIIVRTSTYIYICITLTTITITRMIIVIMDMYI